MTKNSYDNQEDLLLAIAISKGDQQALGKLFDKYAPALAGIICRIVDKDTSIDEILQKVFQHVWREAGLLDTSKHSLFTWLIQISRRKAIETVRSAESKTPATNHTDYLHSNNKEEDGISKPIEKHLFDLLYYKGLSCAELATAMNIPADEIKKHVRMAIKKLKHMQVG